jgi:large repetitive protein
VVTFTYLVCDTGAPVKCDEAMVKITFHPNPLGDNFTFAVDDSFFGEQDSSIAGDLLANDYDPEGDEQSINTTPVKLPTNGQLTINPDGTFIYIPNPGYSGSDQFVYEVCDDGDPLACSQTTVYLLIISVPDISPTHYSHS